MILLAAMLLTGSAISAPEKFASPPVETGKGTIFLYRLRSMLGAAWQPMLFANGDYAGILHLANYTFYQAPPGRVVITSMQAQMKFPPPTDLWPESPCATVDWRQLGSATPAAVSSCKQYLSETISKHSCRGPYGTDCNKFTPFRYVLDTVATREVPIGDAPVALEGSGDFSNFKLQIDVEAGKTYYIEWYVAGRGATMRQVDQGTAEKKVRGLKLAENR